MGGEDSLKWDSPFGGQPLGIQGKEDDFYIKETSPVLQVWES